MAGFLAAFFGLYCSGRLPYTGAMPRANRLTIDGGCSHVTHRYHNRACLVKFGRSLRLGTANLVKVRGIWKGASATAWRAMNC